MRPEIRNVSCLAPPAVYRRERCLLMQFLRIWVEKTGENIMRKTRNMIAFDLGASNGRAILGQFDGERLAMTELHRFENNYVEMNGIFYWDIPYLYS